MNIDIPQMSEEMIGMVKSLRSIKYQDTTESLKIKIKIEDFLTKKENAEEALFHGYLRKRFYYDDKEKKNIIANNKKYLSAREVIKEQNIRLKRIMVFYIYGTMDSKNLSVKKYSKLIKNNMRLLQKHYKEHSRVKWAYDKILSNSKISKIIPDHTDPNRYELLLTKKGIVYHYCRFKDGEFSITNPSRRPRLKCWDHLVDLNKQIKE